MRVAWRWGGAGRRDDTTLHWARLNDSRLANDEWEPNGEVGRQRAEPGVRRIIMKMTPWAKTFQVAALGRRRRTFVYAWGRHCRRLTGE
jgi:hypothetical protein